MVAEELLGPRVAIGRVLIFTSLGRRKEALAGGQKQTVSPAVGAKEETIKRNIRKLHGGWLGAS